jgi:hypothetical protein
MTEEEKLDMVLALYRKRLSGHPTNDDWDAVAQKVCATDRNSSAFNIYQERITLDGLVTCDRDGAWTASHKGLTYSYVSEKQKETISKYLQLFSTILLIAGSVAAVGLLIMEILKYWHHLTWE